VTIRVEFTRYVRCHDNPHKILK